MFVKGSVVLQELISVIIPVYKVEEYLTRCVDSVINQTYKNLEIILVDDGSPDNCGIICDEYAQKDSRIKVIHKENGGLSSARNVGVDVAKGTYIAFVDSDDFIHEEFIEKLYEILKSNDADISQCDFIKTNGEKPNLDTEETIKVYDNISFLDSMYKVNGVHIVVAWNKLYKSELFAEIRYPEGKIHEDEAVIHLLIHKANKCVRTNRQMYYYFINENGIMNAKFSEKRLDIFFAFNSRIDFYMENGLRKYALYDLEKLTFKCMEFYELSKEKCIRKKIKKQIRYNFKLALKLKVSPKSVLRYFLYMVHPVFMDIIHKNYIRRRR